MSVGAPNARVNLITNLLEEALAPVSIQIIDQSHLHANHLEAKGSGGGHFKLQIVSEQFATKTLIERHKMIYAALGNTIGREIHAITIDAKTPLEVTNQRSMQ